MAHLKHGCGKTVSEYDSQLLAEIIKDIEEVKRSQKVEALGEDPEKAALIRKLTKTHRDLLLRNGRTPSEEEIAIEIGIGKTTLWRKRKRFKIPSVSKLVQNWNDSEID